MDRDKGDQEGDRIENYLDNIRHNPIRIIFQVTVNLAVLIYFGSILVPGGPIPLVGYFLVCIYGFSQVLNHPYRTIVWAVPYSLGAYIIYSLLHEADLFYLLVIGTYVGAVAFHIGRNLKTKSEEINIYVNQR